jgi:putative methyltransferase (TIGR04325 family)
MGKLHKLCRNLTPPIIYGYLKKLYKKRSIRGSFKNWNEALNHSTGYDSNEILSKVLKATLIAIQTGGYERDGVHFSTKEYSWPIVCGVLMGALGRSGGTQVLDFGGALGGLYLQHKKILGSIPNLRWNVVDQSNFIDAAKQNIHIHNLDFYYSIDDYLLSSKPNIALFSSVLQYLENLDDILDEVTNSGAKYLIIDRTPFQLGNDHSIKIQYVPKDIYNASYPIRIFSKQALLTRLDGSWILLASGASPEGLTLAQDGSDISFEWLIMERKGV